MLTLDAHAKIFREKVFKNNRVEYRKLIHLSIYNFLSSILFRRFTVDNQIGEFIMPMKKNILNTG